MKTSKKFFWILVAVVVFIGATFPSLGTEVQAATYEKAIFPAPNLYLTQIAYESYSHGEQNAIDISPGGNVFAPFTGKIVQKDANWGFVLLQSNNKVYYSDGTLDYMTVGFMHDSNITDLSVGQTINQGQDFYQAGGMGGGNPNAYGVHVHITVLKGKVDFINPYGNGNVYAYKAFFVNTNKTKISKAGIVEYGNTVNYGAPTNYDGLWKTTTSSVETDNTSSLIKSTYPSSCKIKVTANTTYVKSLPCSEKTDKNSKNLETASKNTQYQAYELIKNKAGNLWYKVKTKTGATGYIFSGNTSYVSQITDDIKASGISVPTNHTYGKSYGLKGSVSSIYNQLTSTSVYIYPGNSTSGTAETGASDSVTNNSYNFGGSTIDNKTLFNKLSNGTHTYVVKASYKNYYAKSGTDLGTNTGTKTVYTTSFTVSSNGSGSATTSNEPTKILYPASNSVVKLASGVGNNMYLDFACTNTNVQIYQNCDGHSNPDFVKSQYFKLTHIGDGWYTIVNTGNGKSVDVYNASAAAGTNVWQYELNKSNAQLFRFYDAGNGYCYIKSKLGCYLDVANGTNANNTNVQMYTFNGSNAQKWKLESHSHSYNSKISTQPTCTKTGVKTFTCKCGTSYTESIAKKAHSYNSSITTQPTCTNTGVKTYKCSCGASYTEKINATGHSWIAATCTSKRTCSKCRITDGPALGHNYCIVSFKWDFSKFPYVLTNETCDVCWTSQEENYKMEYSTNLEFDCGTNYVKISWGERFNDQEFYEVDIIDIYQYDKEQGKYVLIKQVDDSLKSYKITGLKPETEYKFCVVAHPGVWSGDNVWIQGSKQVPVEYIAGITAKTKSTHTHTYKTTTTKATLSKNGKVESKCSVCGKVSKTTVYYPKSIKLSKTAYTYNGKVQTPSVTVKDSKGNTLKKDTDYTVKYESGRKAPGKYTVTITFKGKYSGTKKLTFTIVPATVTLSKVTAGSKQATVAWKTVSGVSGYEIQYSTSSKFSSAKTATVGKGSSNKTTIKKLTKGKKYYFKVRAYKTVDGKKIYGAWSSVKSVKIK